MGADCLGRADIAAGAGRELHGDTLDVIPSLQKKRGRQGAVDATAHGHKNATFHGNISESDDGIYNAPVVPEEFGEQDGFPLARTRNRADNMASSDGLPKAVQRNGFIYQGLVQALLIPPRRDQGNRLYPCTLIREELHYLSFETRYAPR
ncbi:MAG TPA: hypothetical protein DCO77_11365 [Nitrospiraceae bacterium]|nr:hypothetical protein [Nitrospiraceae bacterium]